VEAEYDVEVIG